MSFPRHFLYLIALAALLLPPPLRADQQIRFERFQFAMTIPDSGWNLDTSMAASIFEKSKMLLTIVNEHQDKNLTMFLNHIPGGASRNYDLFTRTLLDQMREKGRVIDTFSMTVRGSRAFRITADFPDTGARNNFVPMCMDAVLSDEFGYIVMTWLSSSIPGRPENDRELRKIVESFVFIDSPGAPGGTSGPPVYDEFVRIDQDNVLIIIGIPTLLIYFWKRHRRRTEERDEGWDESGSPEQRDTQR